MLNRHERQQLTAIEHGLEQSDPSFARRFQEHTRPRPARIALAVSVPVLFILAVLTASPALLLLTVAVLIAAVTLHITALDADR